ncbi:MAG: diacylglycerol kinase family lipid kinase [Anaerolineae bacterium]|nr:diacylglycerol kinase family lipid kinase [Anaerolineae bacterium]MDW8102228.1 diacylglycerol kinase family lipid kinase [Anaerolineae bacterium]
MERIMVIVNPIAANGKVGRKWPSVKEFLEKRGIPFSFALTQYPAHAIALAAEAVERGFKTIVAFGGDGTLNEMVNGVFRHGISSEITLGAIPGGTGSDFTRSLGLPRDPIKAFEKILEGETTRVDLGEIECFKEGRPERRYFINVAGLGFDAVVAERTNRLPKFMGGTLPYLFSLLVTLLTYKSLPFKINIDSQTLELKAYLVVVANGKYFGGGMFIAPEAVLDDGKFYVAIGEDMSRFEFLSLVPSVYKGTHIAHPKVKVYEAQTVKVSSEVTLYIEAEGEVVGVAPATFKVHPRAVNFLC